MRILSITACLALVTVAVAQVSNGFKDPLAAVGNSPDYQWIDSPSVDEPTAVSRQEMSDVISELEFRAAFLDKLALSSDGVSKAEVVVGQDAVSDILAKLSAALDTLKTIPERLGPLGPLINPIITAIQNVLTASSGATPNLSTVLGLLEVLEDLLSPLMPALRLLAPEVAKILDEILTLIDQLPDPAAEAVSSKGLNVDSFQQDLCYPIADLYRSIVDAASKNAASVPEGSSDEMKRSIAGIRAVLDIMAKTSIASNNADLLKTRPIFAADVLDNFREEYIRGADNSDQKLFGGVGLPLVIGSSNALEACLRVADDPTAALEDLNEELDFDDFEDENVKEEGQQQQQQQGQQQQGQQQQGQQQPIEA
ncbi:hypothetical protein BGZ73_004854 [Actinomortierella ambigua]|nr:hypothetical protein BGZ73_004854 [Actinomortierella ambigua]